jgi:hypothetical protein
MDKVIRYRQIIKQILHKYVEMDNRNPNPNVEYYLIADEASDNYLWMNLGWEHGKRINAPTVHVRICDGKILIEEDWTEEGITDELLEAGVPQEDIIFAFQPPRLRKIAA